MDAMMELRLSQVDDLFFDSLIKLNTPVQWRCILVRNTIDDPELLQIAREARISRQRIAQREKALAAAVRLEVT